ncbi:MAG TPA: Dyp-type peroxidase [Acetobacteraceae bacterium]
MSGRRFFLAAAGGLVTAASVPRIASAAASDPFFGQHQAGIATPQQTQTYIAALDLIAKKPGDIVRMLREWTSAAARLTNGQDAPGDSGETLGLDAAGLTLTFGVGAGLFDNRYGLATHRPKALIDLPGFSGDQLVPERSGGDISIQACADDPQVAFHAVRQLVRLADGVARVRWTQTGFLPATAPGETPRNLLGFKDGTRNPKNLADAVWVGSEGPTWMRDGSYLVIRRIRMALEHWDRTDVEFQEEVIGRHKRSGAPIGRERERDAPDFEALDQDGNPRIAENAHLRLAAPETNNGTQILRRGYSYNDGANFTAERWPPWRQGIEYDAGLLFIAYQRDPRTGFVRLFENMSKIDALNQFTTHVGSALFACPGGVREGQFLAQELFDAA